MRRWWACVVLLLAACGSSPANSTSPPVTTPTAPSPATPTSAPSSPPARTSGSAAPAPRTSPARGSLTPLPAADRAVGFVDVRTAVPDAIVDLRYATTDNFTHVRLYPPGARCLVHRSMVAGLRTTAERLRAAGYRLVFWDCYRPHAVQVRMYRVVPNPAWVAEPGPYSRSHETGRSVDVTLSRSGHLVDMGTGFDDFTPRAFASATDVGAGALANRARLRHAMEAGGLAVYSGEWWHFDGPGAFVRRPVVDVPLG